MWRRLSSLRLSPAMDKAGSKACPTRINRYSLFVFCIGRELGKINPMEVITTHLNADFDAFGSMVAAKRLYPGAVVAFPGSQEKSVRDFFMESALYILSIEKAKDIDLNEIDRLILVDTRQRSRIGRFAEIVDSGRVEVHIYDHHPDSDEDIKGDLEVIKETGSTVSILVPMLRERELEITAEEATVLALGIYEDTGSFTFSSTTGQDFDAAAWLLKKGANVNIISDMMTNELSKAQIEIFYQFIEEAEIINVGGVEVLITTASVETYVQDVAVLVHKYKEMENLDAIFALVRMEGRVHLVARSRLDAVNAGEVVAEFGGGGHPTAASASIRDLSLYEAKEKLVRLLHEKVRPKKEVSEIMSRPVITIEPDRNLEEAADYLNRYQVSSLPVVNNGKIEGILHRHAVDKALHHGLQQASVSEYMDPEFVSVSPHESIETVISVSVDNRSRLVPVMDHGTLVGVISRSDLLEHMKLPRAKDSASPEEFPGGRMRSRNVRKLMEEQLPPAIMEILRSAGEVASSRGEDVYLVGGAVRDLLLRNPNLDVDLVVEGDGIPFARELSRTLEGSRVRSHEKFRTAVLLFPDGFKIDVATARHEYYSRPGALPTVETSSIKRDLFRRDFTMNTVAVCLSPQRFGQVLDFFGGARDIKERIIRVLNNLSFVEDPTRILRAVRFSSRFNFAISKHTLGLMRRAVKMRVFDKVEGTRICNELVHILEEKTPLPPLMLMDDLGILPAIHPALSFIRKTKELLESVVGVLAWWRYLYMSENIEPWILYFLGMTDGISDEEFRDMLIRLSLTQNRIAQLGKERVQIRKSLSIFAGGDADRPSKVAAALRGLSMEGLLQMMAKTSREETRKSISEYILSLRHVRPALTGEDLLAMGYKPGPVFGKILAALRDARLDKVVRTESEERDLIRTLFPTDSQSTAPGGSSAHGARKRESRNNRRTRKGETQRTFK